MLQRSGGCGRLKHQAGQRPSKGGKCCAVGVSPLRFRSSVFSEAGEGKNVRGARKRDASLRARRKKARKVKSPGEQRLHSARNRGGEREARLAMRAEAVVASVPSPRDWRESARTDHAWETARGPQGRRKALEGEAQERGELKEASEGGRADTVERVVKP